METRKINRWLNLYALQNVLFSGIIVVLFETNILPVGILGPVYSYQVAGVILTLAFVPIALGIMAIGRVRRAVSGNLRNYLYFGLLRLGMLGFALLFDVTFYYLMLDTSMLYCALIVALSFIFVWPTMNRLERETSY